MRKAISKRLRSTVAFGLMLWCAGAGCLVVSYARGAINRGTADARPELMSQGIEAAAGSHSCCKARRRETRKSAGSQTSREVRLTMSQVGLPQPRPAGATSCCPLTSGSFVTVSRVQTNDASAVASPDLIALLTATGNQIVSPNRTPYLPHLDQTYLRDCAFLI